MNWIEQIFGFSPDGGDGSLERAIVFGAAGIICVGAAIWASLRLARIRRTTTMRQCREETAGY